MDHDPIHQGQLLIWRAGHILEKELPDTTRLDLLDQDGRQRFFDKGREQVETLAQRIEAQTGFSLESSTVLDFGCGVGRNALPLAERCAHVYGLDISPAVLREADSRAKELGLGNVEWMDASRLDELAGRYDLVVSFFVFQHIPSREGERVFDKLVRGLRPGGAGAIHVTIRPSFRRLTRSHLYMLMNSYSLNRLARLLAAAGVTEWHAKLHPRPAPGGEGQTYEDATIIFRRD
jgi:2-polyprenyl-3-methyl-5-hydroxy-6-metoxy-1,4-benzoquinol methylase